jgi:hypothetical protein
MPKEKLAIGVVAAEALLEFGDDLRLASNVCRALLVENEVRGWALSG